MLRLKELEISATLSPHAPERSPAPLPDFDSNRNIHLVPVFLEKDVDKYFILFERRHISLCWRLITRSSEGIKSRSLKHMLSLLVRGIT